MLAATVALSGAITSACGPGAIGDSDDGPRPDGGAAIGSLEVHFLDVGQGDGTLLVGPDGSALLFDGGPRGAEAVVRSAVDTLAGGTLRAALLSHTDADHIGGLVGLLRGPDGDAGTADDLVPATRYIGHADEACDTQVCGEFRTLTAYPFVEPAVGDVIDLGGATVTVIARDGDAGSGALPGADEENERSLAIVVEHAGRRIFIGGDLTGGGLGSADVEGMVASAIGPVDVLHLNHHGSQTSSSAGFLAAASPRAIVLSVGTDNAYCHPAMDVIDRVGALEVPIFATGSGMVADGARCDGATAWPAGARPGLGTFSVVVDERGGMTIAGEPL